MFFYNGLHVMCHPFFITSPMLPAHRENVAVVHWKDIARAMRNGEYGYTIYGLVVGER